MKLLVVDSNSIIYRAFYGIRILTTKDGRYTNAIVGFLNILHKMLEEVSPDTVIFAFDMRAETFRHKDYSEYKAGRKPMPEELAQQIPVIREIIGLLGYSIVEIEGYEADDILGTISLTCKQQGSECVIATGDRDSLQLISDRVTVRLASTKGGQPVSVVYDEAKLMEEYGLNPSQMIDVKALMGDSSDNIPGVAGIGEKTAVSLIREYGSIDYIYDNLDKLDIKEHIRTKLNNGRQNAFMSKELARICCSVPVSLNLADYARAEMDKKGLLKLLASLECFSLINKFGLNEENIEDNQLNFDTAENNKPINCNVSDDADLLERLAKAGEYFTAEYKIVDNAIDSVLVMVEEEVIIFSLDNHKVKARLYEILSDNSIKKRVFSSKPLFLAALLEGVEINGLEFDCQLAAYLLNPSANSYYRQRLYSEYSIEFKKADTPEGYEQMYDIEGMSRLFDRLQSALNENGQTRLLREIEIPLAKVLASMEIEGFMIDKPGLEEFNLMIEERLSRAEAEIIELAGEEFNINSPKQLGEILFGKLGLPYIKKTKTGYSTNAEVLEKLKNYHPVINHILDYRQLQKIKSTYTDPLLAKVDKDCRIHSSFIQTETRTGRISSIEPNLQNIPIKHEIGRQLRKFFIAKEGYKLIDADYSQIELRILAHMSGDRRMLDGFKNGEDIHSITASQVFGLPLELVTPQMRNNAKAVNFGIVYGISAFSLAEDIGVTRSEADSYIKSYFRTYPAIKEYMDRVIEKAKLDGYVTTLFGRKRYIPELASSNANIRAFGERVAMNAPIQGTAADIIKIAMIRVYDRLKSEGLDARLILQVHDELIVEAVEDQVDRVESIVGQEMEKAASLDIVLKAETSTGKSWYEAKQ